jgi:hypothetical protein
MKGINVAWLPPLLLTCGDGKTGETGEGLPGPGATDADGDGWYYEADDCDDDDSTINPGAAEVCDGVDNDCNGVADDQDVDNDGYLADASGGAGCAGDDCDDSDASIQPRYGNETACNNGIDEDCDTSPDDGCTNEVPIEDYFDYDEYAAGSACATAVEALLAQADPDGDSVVDLEVWRAYVVDSTRERFLMEDLDRRPVWNDSRSFRHPRGAAFLMGDGNGDGAWDGDVQGILEQWDEYDAGVGVREVLLLVVPATGEIVGYAWEWEKEHDEASDTWDPMTLGHWAVRSVEGCGHPVAVGEWNYTASWKSAIASTPGVYGPWTEGGW